MVSPLNVTFRKLKSSCHWRVAQISWCNHNVGKKSKAEGVRDSWRYQNGWIFGRIPNSLWPPPSFSENHIALFSPKIALKSRKKAQNLQYKLDWKWPPPPPLYLSRKFIHFGTFTRPLAWKKFTSPAFKGKLIKIKGRFYWPWSSLRWQWWGGLIINSGISGERQTLPSNLLLFHTLATFLSAFLIVF